MNNMEKSRKTKEIINLLRKQFPNPKTALEHKNVHQLLISTILSAQCTDKRVNIVTKELFKKYKSIKDFAKVRQTDLEKDIKSTGFYRSKAKNIIKCSKQIIEEFDGKVPAKMEDLVKLAGVGRKTANVVLGNWFGKDEGIVVDTHVTRLSNRLGLTKSENAVIIERDLIKIVPKKDWKDFSHLLISHGRKTCVARNPKCKECVLLSLCEYGRKKLKN